MLVLISSCNFFVLGILQLSLGLSIVKFGSSGFGNDKDG